MPEFTAYVAPTSFAFSSLLSDKSKTKISLAPAARAAITVNNPIGPAPNTATESLNFISDSLIACKATAVGSTSAANSSDVSSCNLTTFSLSTMT